MRPSLCASTGGLRGMPAAGLIMQRPAQVLRDVDTAVTPQSAEYADTFYHGYAVEDKPWYSSRYGYIGASFDEIRRRMEELMQATRPVKLSSTSGAASTESQQAFDKLVDNVKHIERTMVSLHDHINRFSDPKLLAAVFEEVENHLSAVSATVNALWSRVQPAKKA